MSSQGQSQLPLAYQIRQEGEVGVEVPSFPRVVFIEVTNRCNLSCETCPRTYQDREPLKTLSYEEFVEQLYANCRSEKPVQVLQRPDRGKESVL